MRKSAIILALFIFGCSTVPEFIYQPVKFGWGEGYEEVKLDNDKIELKILSMYGHSYQTLQHYFHRRAEEICKGPRYQIFEFSEMIDVCADAKCFKTAVMGVFKCT